VNIVSEIRRQGHGSRIAIRGEGVDMSFDALFLAVEEIRERILARACFKSQARPRIGIRFPNGADYIATALAVLDAGACFVPIPDELTSAEHTALIERTALDLVITPTENGGLEFRELSPPTPDFPIAEFEALNPAFVRFSSGTTGDSKGVVLSHESLMERILAANAGLCLAPGDRVLWTLPMAHHFAVTIILYLYHGVTTVLETSHQPERIFRAARESRTNLLYGSPFHFAQLAQCQEAGPLPDLRMAISTASALPEEVAVAFEKRFALPLTQALGIIEIGLPLLNTKHAKDQPTALGQPLPGYQIRTADDGELLIKGPGMFDAYLSPWQPRAQVLRDGWFATGDLVEITADHTVTMRGRSKSLINVGGMKVFPEEIEAVLDAHPAIRMSRVFAQNHPALGSFPCAEIVPADGSLMPAPMEIRNWCAERLAIYKIPMQIERVESIDLTASGKLNRC
jgi:long-chain acyl-CoA synthetase